MATAIEHSPCLLEMPAHWLRVPECCDNDPTSPTSVGRTQAIEGIVRRTHCLVLFGSVDSDVSDLGSQWMDPTPRPRLHVRPCAPLGIPVNMIITTCGILCWDFSVMCKLAYLWSRTLMKLFWGESHSPVTSHLIPSISEDVTAASSLFWSTRQVILWNCRVMLQVLRILPLMNGKVFVGTYLDFSFSR